MGTRINIPPHTHRFVFKKNKARCRKCGVYTKTVLQCGMMGCKVKDVKVRGCLCG